MLIDELRGLITQLEDQNYPHPRYVLECAIRDVLRRDVPGSPAFTAPGYLTSIDVAMTLIPGGWEWHASGPPIIGSFVEWFLVPPVCERVKNTQIGRSPYPAEALTIACLKAMVWECQREVAPALTKKARHRSAAPC